MGNEKAAFCFFFFFFFFFCVNDVPGYLFSTATCLSCTGNP